MYRLLSFTIENFRSFCTAQTISLDGGDKHSVTAVFGPNAGGKSNIARALSTFVACVRNSSEANWRLPYEPFLLKAGMDARPTSFSIEFLRDGRRYDYTFSYLFNRVVREELKEESARTGRMNKVFERTEEGLNPYARQFGFGKRLLDRTRAETLLVTKGREDNNEYSNIIFDLLDHVTVISPSADPLGPLFVDMLKNDVELRRKTLELLRSCDFAIRDIKFSDVMLPEEFFDQMPVQLPPDLKRAIMEKGSTAFTTVHALRDDDRSIVGYRELDFWNQESMGTQKFFEVAVPIIDALENGKAIFIDEYGSFIHPTLSGAILALFEGRKDNGAYMMLTTHDTTLLRNLDRSEIVLVEKNHAEESLITSLASLGVRDGEAFEKRYLSGMYGAIPIIER